MVQLEEPLNDGGTGSGMNPLNAHGMVKYIQSCITSHEKLQLGRMERDELVEDLIQFILVLFSLLLPLLAVWYS